MSGSFAHLHAAHCESGVTAALFRHAGLPISEPMAFGIGSGLFFCHLPFVKVMGHPLTSFRNYPGWIFRRACRRLGVTYRRRTFRRPADGRRALDALVADGVPVAVQTNIHWLPYFPPEFRSQFNGHNLIVIGREGERYRISDPVLPETVECPVEALDRARFAKGTLAPRGLLYHPVSAPSRPDFAPAIRAGIKEAVFHMRAPFPWVGVRGIRYLASRMRTWPDRPGGLQRARLDLAFLVRMQEEVGTGGAGFRFMYAAFLEEAAGILGSDSLRRASAQMTAAGDQWREFAVAAGRLLKGRDDGRESFSTLADRLESCADREREVLAAMKAAA